MKKGDIVTYNRTRTGVLWYLVLWYLSSLVTFYCFFYIFQFSSFFFWLTQFFFSFHRRNSFIWSFLFSCVLLYSIVWLCFILLFLFLSVLNCHYILLPFCFSLLLFSRRLTQLYCLQVLWEKQTRRQKNENKTRGNKAVDLQLQTEKHFHILCECVAEGFPVVPVQGIPSVPAEKRASEERATPRGNTEKIFVHQWTCCGG